MPITTTEIITIISSVGLVLSVIWNFKSVNKMSRDETERSAVRMANIENSISNIAGAIKRLESFERQFDKLNSRFMELGTQVAVIKNEIKNILNERDCINTETQNN